MQQPKRPWPPYESSYKATVENKYIYFHKEKLDGYYGDEDEERDNAHMELTSDQEKLPKKSPNETTLAWLLSQVPDGVKPEDIKIDFGSYASRERIENHHVGFYYEVKVPTRMKQYKIDKAKFDTDMEQYEKDLAAYKEWLRLEEIRKTEEKLKALKGQD